MNRFRIQYVKKVLSAYFYTEQGVRLMLLRFTHIPSFILLPCYFAVEVLGITENIARL